MSQKDQSKTEGDAQTLTIERLQKPKMYGVLLINDDYTPMEFVVWLIEKVFHKTKEEAHRLMLDVHLKGRGLCGIYTFDVARTKMMQVEQLAKKHEHPLQCEIEAME